MRFAENRWHSGMRHISLEDYFCSSNGCSSFVSESQSNGCRSDFRGVGRDLMCEDQICVSFGSSPAARQNQTSTKDKPQKHRNGLWMRHEVTFFKQLGVRRSGSHEKAQESQKGFSGILSFKFTFVTFVLFRGSPDRRTPNCSGDSPAGCLCPGEKLRRLHPRRDLFHIFLWALPSQVLYCVEDRYIQS